jgi:hypothetical protein
LSAPEFIAFVSHKKGSEVRMRLRTLLFGLTTCCASPLVAQHPGLSPRLAAALESSRGPLPRALHESTHPTHWKEGAIIGGAVGVLFGAGLGGSFCGMATDAGRSCTGSAVLGAVAGGLILAIPGAIIGGAFPKHSHRDADGGTRSRGTPRPDPLAAGESGR